MRRQARPHMAVVADGFARRVGVELAGPECCLIPAGGTRNGSVERAGFPSSSLLSSVGDQRFGDVRYVN
jgi:hypothetical protein